MRQRTFFAGLVGTLLLGACGGAEVTVLAELEEANLEGETTERPLQGIVLNLLPYDRDAIFDSLEAAHPVPQPPIPDTILALRSEMAEAEAEWRAAEQEWAQLRDNLQQLLREMEGLNRGEARYVRLFGEFQDQEARVNQVEREKDQAFARFTELQDQTFQQAEEIRLLRDQWADEAFVDFSEIALARLRETGRRVVTDTTNANGLARLEAPPGQWWVYGRYELPFTELYWNVPVTLQRGEPLQLRLNRGNAEARPTL